MARDFDETDVRRICQFHTDLLNRLEETQPYLEQDRSKIQEIAEKIIDRNVWNLLQEISVDELSKERLGIRVKALQDSGFRTMADIVASSVYQLASVYGISEESAYQIKRIANQYAANARSNMKLKISADNRTDEYTKLVLAVDIYKEDADKLRECQKLYQQYSQRIQEAIKDVSPGLHGGIKWFFTSGAKKRRAKTAFAELTNLKLSEYAVRSRYLVDCIEQDRAMTATQAWMHFSKKPIAFITALEEIIPNLLGNNDTEYGLPEYLAREIQDQCFFPDGLLCTLRRYQEWGVKYILHQEMVLLGDEMGLGKTIQAIATMVSLKNTGASHFLVICPASVITNWCREIVEKSKLSVIRIHGAGRTAALRDWIQSGGVAVTTYETTGYIHLESSFRFTQLIVDEAHYIKNPDARRTINVKKIAVHADRQLFMTGTALENKVEEMITLIEMLRPYIAESVKNMTFMASAPEFREKIAPVYYRRKREDVLTELPEKIEMKEWCTLLPIEESVYENAVLSKNYTEARRVSWNIDDLSQSSKAKRLKEIVEEAESDGRKIIVFSFFLDTIRKVTYLLGSKCTQPINGSISPQMRQEIIDYFDKAPAGTVLPAQIQSGGTGLNIQSASVVILCEPQFKPSIENQAISRAYRMGQTRNVLVYRLLCENTVDEKIMNMIEDKQKVFDAFADKSVAAEESIELDATTFGNIIKEEIDRINSKKQGKG